MEWNVYVHGLKMRAITLKASPDVIRWSFDPVGGKISAKLAYQLLINEVPERYAWCFQI